MIADLSWAERTRFFAERLQVWQPKREVGYRFNLDPVLLAGLLPTRGRVVDLGAGTGIIGLLLLVQAKATEVLAVEREPQLVALLERNAAEHHAIGKLTPLFRDVRDLSVDDLRSEGSLDPSAPTIHWVVFNPPYFRPSERRPSGNPLREVTRTEHHGNLRDFVAAGVRLNPTEGVGAILPATRRREFEALLAEFGWHVGSTVTLQARASRPPHLVVVRGHSDPPAECGEQRLVIHEDDGRYAAWVRHCLGV